MSFRTGRLVREDALHTSRAKQYGAVYLPANRLLGAVKGGAYDKKCQRETDKLCQKQAKLIIPSSIGQVPSTLSSQDSLIGDRMF
jgi:hypothetical protein